MRAAVWMPLGMSLLGLAACSQALGLDDDFVDTSGSSASGGSSATAGGTTATTSSAGGASSSAGGASSSSSTGGSGGSASGSGGSGGVPSFVVNCGMNDCTITSDEACCWDEYQQYSAPRAECVSGPVEMDDCVTSQTQGGGFETRIECQLPEHCPAGTVCCGDRRTDGSNFWYAQLTCETSCDDPDRVVCDLNDGSNCAAPFTCVDSSLLPNGYAICSTP
jgi:hypothetical protein